MHVFVLPKYQNYAIITKGKTVMFSQTNRLNANKCNGCKKHCEIDAVYYEKKRQGFLPTICGKTIKYYIDTNNTKRFLHLYRSRYNAIDAAKTITRTCTHYVEKFSTVQSSDANTCTGCNKLCKLGTHKTTNGFLPTINNQTIHGYIDAHGTLQISQQNKNIPQTIQYAKQIAARCDFYKKQRQINEKIK